ARHQRQILWTVPSQLRSPAHLPMPVLPGFGLDQRAVPVAPNDPSATAAHDTGQSRYRPGQYQIAAAAEQLYRPTPLVGQRQRLAQLGVTVHQAQLLSALVYAKGIERCQAGTAYAFEAHQPAASSCRTRSRSSGVSTPAGGT